MTLVPKNLQAQLKQILHDSMKAGYKATFINGAGRDGEQMAEKFASTVADKASKDLADAITNYIKTATITGGLVTTTGTALTQAGPITVQPTIS